MLGFVSIFAASLAGYTDVGVWTIAACAIALTSTSYAEHQAVYRRGQQIGLSDTLGGAVVRSYSNGLVAAGTAYACGWLLRLL